MSNENLLPIVQAENIAPIVKSAPESYSANKLSCQRCNAAGKSILDSIIQCGMTDELDQKAASFIDKARRTVKAMNERRTPVTKLFDQIRGSFTSLENSIDPTKTGTIAYQLQAKRNEYAAKKREEAELRQRELIEKQQFLQKRNKLMLDITDDIKRQFQAVLDERVRSLQELGNSLTLDNYGETEKKLRDWPTQLPDNWLRDVTPNVLIPYELKEESPSVISERKEALRQQLEEQYKYEAETNRDYILDRLPSKKAELERIAKANADEKAKMQKEKAEREAAEAAKLEEERKKKEMDEIRRQQAQRQAEQMQSLFDSQATVNAYQPNSKVSKRIHLLNPEGILPVISMWWTNEGRNLTADELVKMFRKQVTYVEKLANAAEPTFIKDESVEYIDEVKAK